jgi:methyl-accepting chemotaxis protein
VEDQIAAAKNLAERSKKSTIQIRSILTDIQKEISGTVMATEKGSKVIDSGIELSSKANVVITTLASNIEQTSQSNMQIAASSKQQLIGMDQIKSAMENINEASTQTSNSTKQAEDSISELKNLGEKLLLILKQYKLK